MRSAKPLLLVEDDLDDAMIVKRALGELGIEKELIHLPDAEAALTYLRSPATAKPALILLDLNLPGMGGVKLLETIKADPALAEIAVVVLSTSDERRDIVDSFDLSVAGYIVKPANYASLVEALRIVQDYWSLNHLPACHN
ncbi:MAG: response regulator [Phycisphaerae bacterium]|nr:response regulator [Phycisphaerae bacterium]